MDAIKKLLGEDLFSKVKEKLNDQTLVLVDKGHKALVHKEDEEPVITNNGEWIPKTKFNDKLTEIKTLKDELKGVQTQLSEASKGAKDLQELQTKVQTLSTELETNKTESEKREKNLSKKYALKEALMKSGAKHPDLLETKFKLDDLEVSEDGTIKDFDSKLKPLQETYADLFGDVEFKGGGGSGTGKPNKDVKLPDGFITHEQFKQMSVKDRVANVDKINESSPHWEENQ